VIANRLGVRGGVLDGTVEGPIVGAQTKRETLLATLAEQGWSSDDAMAIGDGANDIPMIEAATYGLAYRAKPKARSAADGWIDRGDLTAVLELLGIPRGDWVAE
jgi:phosphoserine phosphatase